MARGGTSNSSKDASVNAADNAAEEMDPRQRKRIQNRLAQRTYRKLKKRMEALEHWRDVAVAAANGSPLDPLNMNGINEQLSSLTGKSTPACDPSHSDPSHTRIQQPPLATVDAYPSPVDGRQTIPLPSSHSDQPKLPWTPLSDSALSLKEYVEESNYTEGEDYTSYVWEAVRGTPMEDNSAMALRFQQSNSVVPTSLLEPASDELSPPQPSSPPSPLPTTPHNGKTALHLAAELGQQASVRLLLDRRADITAQDALGRTALHLAVENRQEAVVQALLWGVGNAHPTHNGCHPTNNGLTITTNVNHTTNNGNHITNSVIDVQDNDGQTALHITVRTGQGNMVEALLRAGADLEIKDRAGRTALHLAVVMGEEVLVRLLLDGKADAGAKVG
ncbi:hypothetical protein MMC30_003680 [Trapelia coarctata]|nr:hypothetical protein [Trapelia coarctata]